MVDSSSLQNVPKRSSIDICQVIISEGKFTERKMVGRDEDKALEGLHVASFHMHRIHQKQ